MAKPTNLFTLVIDEDRAEVLQMMYTAFADRAEVLHSLFPEDMERLAPCLLELTKEIGVKVHENGWCKAEDCSHPKHE
jgi:hypothetical protein